MEIWIYSRMNLLRVGGVSRCSQLGHQLDHQLDHQWAVIEGGLAELQKALTADDLADIGGEVHLARPRQYPQHVDFQ